MKRFLFKAACLLAAVLLVAVNTAAPVMANRVIEDARNSVVRVVADFGDGGGGIGTAFVVSQSGGNTTLVTNLHCVAQYIYDEYGTVIGFTPATSVHIVTEDMHNPTFEARVIFLRGVDPSLDLVLLTVGAGLADRPVLPLATDRDLRAGESLYALGFPGAADAAHIDALLLPSRVEDVTVTRGVASRPLYEHDTGMFILERGIRTPAVVTAIQSDVLIHQGNSGGPMLNERGEVVGVNTFGVHGIGGFIAYSIHISYIVEAMERLGISHTTLNTGNNFLLPLLLGGGALVLVGGVFAFMKYRPAAASAPAPAPLPSRGASASVVCTSGPYTGKTFEIGHGLAFGRDASRVQVVFPKEAEGISSLHCVLKNAGGITLTDMGSTNGTFLANGRKLDAHTAVTLKPGDSFYLANKNNVFQLL